MSTFCRRFYHRKCQLRGVGGQKKAKNLRVIFDQWPKLHLGLDALSNQKTLNGIYYTIKVIIWNLDHVS